MISPGRSTRGEVEHTRAVYVQVDRQPGHTLVLARDTERLLFDLAPDLGEVDKPFFEVEELVALVATRGVDQPEDKRGGAYDTLAAGEEVAPDDASKYVNRWCQREGEERKQDESLFKHAGFARRLTADLQKGILRRGSAKCWMDFLTTANWGISNSPPLECYPLRRE